MLDVVPKKKKTPTVRGAAAHSDLDALDAFWQVIIDLFITMRRYEGPENTARIRLLIKVLTADSTAVYDEANKRERGMAIASPISLRERMDRYRSDIQDDPRIAVAYEMIRRVVDRPNATEPTPEELRAYAVFVIGVADRHTFMLDQMRRQPRTPVGRRTSFSMDALLFAMAKVRAPDADVARRLVAANLVPEGYGPANPDPVVRWENVIKSARRRRRQ